MKILYLSLLSFSYGQLDTVTGTNGTFGLGMSHFSGCGKFFFTKCGSPADPRFFYLTRTVLLDDPGDIPNLEYRIMARMKV